MGAEISDLIPLGRRELNKREKLDRIRRSTRELFLEKGFDGTTIREIADRANVAFGTIFLYAKDKSDLLLLLYDEQLDDLTDRAFAQKLDGLGFVDQLVTVFETFYRFFLEAPQLSRYMMREATFFSTGVVGMRLLAGLRRTERHLAELIAANQANNMVTSAVSAGVLAELIFMLYRAEVRLFLSQESPNLPDGIVLLRRNFTILFNGLRPDPESRANVV